MATIEYTWQAPLVAQKTTVTVGGTITTETFNILVGGVVIATFTASSSTAGEVAIALADAWNASTDPRAIRVTATAVSSTVELLSDIPGLPFEITLNTPGGSATFSQAATIPNSGPQDASRPLNYSSGSLPTTNDILVFKQGSVNICWGLEALASADLGGIQHYDSYTGSFGLNPFAMCVNAEGTEFDLTVREYRKVYFKVDMFASTNLIEIGIPADQISAGNNESVSGRMMLWTVNPATILIHKTFGASSDAGKPCTRLLTNNSTNTTNVMVRKCRGGLGIATELVGEACKILNLELGDDPNSTVFVGSGVSWDNYTQRGMNAEVNNALGSGATLIDVYDGILLLHEGIIATTANFRGGYVTDLGGNVNLATVLLSGGVWDTTKCRDGKYRKVSNLKLRGGTLKATRKSLVNNTGATVDLDNVFFGGEADGTMYEVTVSSQV